MKNGAPETKKNACSRLYEIDIIFTVVSILLDFKDSKFDLMHSLAKIHISNFVGNKAKGQISKRVFQENKARQNFRKINISYPLIRTPGGKKCLFFGNFGVLCFLEIPALRFALLPYYRRFETSDE